MTQLSPTRQWLARWQKTKKYQRQEAEFNNQSAIDYKEISKHQERKKADRMARKWERYDSRGEEKSIRSSWSNSAPTHK